jgi:hypothetical protein
LTRTPVASAIKNPAHDWLLSQSSTGQVNMLAKMVGGGYRGKTAFYQGNMRSGAGALPGTENDAFWSIRCYDGRSYEVEVHPDGSGKVLECSVLKAMHAGECFKKFE